MAETLAELVARISVDAANLKKGLAEADKDIAQTGKAIGKETKSIKERFLEIGKAATVAGASITAAMGLAIKSFVKTGSELNDLSLKTGVSVKSLAGLKYAAEQNGASLGTIEMAIRRTSMALVDAGEGLAETKRAFDRMGLSLSQLEGMKPEEKFLKIAYAIAEIPDPMTRAATAQDLFGRSGMDMLPMLAAGADGLKRMMDEGVKLTGWTTEGAAKADALGDSFGALTTALSGTFNAIGESLAPALQSLSGTLLKITGYILEWVRQNPALVKAISTAVLTVGALTTALGLASLAVKYLGTVTNFYFGGALIAVGALITGIILLVDWYGRGEQAARKLAEEQRESLKKQRDDMKAYYDNKRSLTEKDFNSSVDRINKEYGIAESTIKSKIDLAKEATQKQKEEYSKEKDAARDRYDSEMQQLRDIADAKLAAIDVEADATVKALQDQIDAIDKQTDAEELALQRREESQKLATLTGKEREEYAAEIARRELLRSREAEKDALRERIAEARTQAEERKKQVKDETDTALKNLQMKYDAEVKNYNDLAVVADSALERQLVRIETERLSKLDSEKQKFDAEIKRLNDAEKANNDALALQLNQAHTQVKNINSAYDALKKRYDIEIVTTERTVRSSEGGVHTGIGGQQTDMLVHGGEAVIPNDAWGGNIVIQIDSFTANSEREIDNLAEKIVKLIRGRTGMR